MNSSNNPQRERTNRPTVVGTETGQTELWKVVMLGDNGVGKTALAHRFCGHNFEESYDATIQASYTVPVTVNGRTAYLEILDTAGLDDYSSLRDQAILESQGFIIVYSTTKRETFDSIQRFRERVYRLHHTRVVDLPLWRADLSPLHPRAPVFLLVGNKLDDTLAREVTTMEALTYGHSIAANAVEASAKSGHNVEKLFYDIVRELGEQQHVPFTLPFLQQPVLAQRGSSRESIATISPRNTAARHLWSITRQSETSRTSLQSLKSASVTATTELWSVTAQDGSTRASIQTITSGASTTATELWSVTAQTGSSRASVGTIISATSTPATELWSVAAQAGSSRSSIRTITSATSTAATELWSVRAQAGSDRSSIQTIGSATSASAMELWSVTAQSGYTRASIQTLTSASSSAAGNPSPGSDQFTLSSNPKLLLPKDPESIPHVPSHEDDVNEVLLAISDHVMAVQRIGEYPVGSGAYSDVWMGKRSTDGTAVALKALRFNVYGTRIYRRFVREVLIWLKLKDPHVLPFLGVSFELNSQKLCLVSPWMPDGDVNHFLRNHPDHDRTTIVRGIAHGLSYMHSIDVVHGDLKGDNILMTADGEPLLADFGLSLLLEEAVEGPTTTTAEAGSVRWMAPERLQPHKFDISGNASRSPSSDIYAYAMVVYEIMSGRMPFDTLNIWEIASFIMDGKRPRHPGLEAVSRGLTTQIWSFVLECWQERSGSRPALSSLEAILGGTAEPIDISVLEKLYAGYRS